MTKSDSKLSIYITGLFCFLFVATTIRWTTTTVEILLFIFLLFSFYFSKEEIRGFSSIPREQKLFFYSLIFLLFSYLLTFVLGKGWELESIKRPGYPSLTDLDIPERYLMGIFVILFFLRMNFKIKQKFVMCAIGIGGIINGIIALYERYILGMDRVDGLVGIAEMGTASSILCLFGTIFFIFSKDKREQIFFLISILFASCASFSTAARSAVISLIIAICVMMIILFFKNREIIKKAIPPIVGMVAIFAFLWSFPVSQDTFRIQAISTDIAQYEKDNPHTSIGMRFEMWKEAWTMFQMSPIYGMSTAVIAKKTDEIIQKSGSRIREKNDLGLRGTKHSQIMEALAKRGAVGLLALLVLWWTSLKMFGKNLQEARSENFQFELCGFLGVFYFIFINSFTGEPWDSMVDTPMIILICALFIKLVEFSRNESKHLSHNPC